MYSATIETKDQFYIVLKDDNIYKIIISRDCFDEKEITDLVNLIKKNNKLAFIKLERISRYEKFKNLRKDTDALLNTEGLDGVLITNLDSLYYVVSRIKHFGLNINIDIDYSLNIYNEYTKKVIKDIIDIDNEISFTTGLELNKPNIKEIGFDTLVIYTYIPNMTSANCIYLNTNKCTKGKNILNNEDYFHDRMNKKIYFKTYCKYCYNNIFNYVPLIFYDLKDEINSLGIKEFRYDFHFENKEEVRKVLNNTIYTKEFTRGYLNKVLK